MAEIASGISRVLSQGSRIPTECPLFNDGMQLIETIFGEVVDILENYRANKDKGKKVEYDPEL